MVSQNCPQFISNFANVSFFLWTSALHHDDVIKWKYFPRYWSFVWGIHRSPVNSPHKGQWHGALMFSLICIWTDDWVNNRDACHLRCHHAHYDITVMIKRSKIEICQDQNTAVGMCKSRKMLMMSWADSWSSIFSVHSYNQFLAKSLADKPPVFQHYSIYMYT